MGLQIEYPILDFMTSIQNKIVGLFPCGKKRSVDEVPADRTDVGKPPVAYAMTEPEEPHMPPPPTGADRV